MAASGKGAVSADGVGVQREIHALYTAHHSWLYGWLRSKLGNTGDAADLAHDTFLRVMLWQRAPSQLGDAPRAFLTHIAKGLVVDHWRRMDVERAFLDAITHLPEPLAPSPEVRYIMLEALYRIEAMLRGLPSQTREIFLMSQLDGMIYADIALKLNVSLVTVKRHMRTAFIACLSLD